LRSTIPPSVSLYVCQSVTRLSCANTAERIEVLLEVETLGGSVNTVLDWCSDPPIRERGGEWGTNRPIMNMPVLTHSPDDATFNAATAKLLYILAAQHTICARLKNFRIFDRARRFGTDHSRNRGGALVKGKGKGKCIAVCIHIYTATGNHLPYGITVLPATRQR